MITDFFTAHTIDMLLKLVTALSLGIALGVERALVGKTAGMRTYGLVALGSALFTIIGAEVAGGTSDSLRLTGQIITGIGFVGAGLIFFSEGKITGVTTAVGIWVAAGIGMAVGYGFYTIALTTSIFSIFVFSALWYIENKLKVIAAHESHEVDEQEPSA